MSQASHPFSCTLSPFVRQELRRLLPRLAARDIGVVMYAAAVHALALIVARSHLVWNFAPFNDFVAVVVPVIAVLTLYLYYTDMSAKPGVAIASDLAQHFIIMQDAGAIKWLKSHSMVNASDVFNPTTGETLLCFALGREDERMAMALQPTQRDMQLTDYLGRNGFHYGAGLHIFMSLRKPFFPPTSLLECTDKLGRLPTHYACREGVAQTNTTRTFAVQMVVLGPSLGCDMADVAKERDDFGHTALDYEMPTARALLVEVLSQARVVPLGTQLDDLLTSSGRASQVRAESGVGQAGEGHQGREIRSLAGEARGDSGDAEFWREQEDTWQQTAATPARDFRLPLRYFPIRRKPYSSSLFSSRVWDEQEMWYRVYTAVQNVRALFETGTIIHIFVLTLILMPAGSDMLVQSSFMVYIIRLLFGIFLGLCTASVLFLPVSRSMAAVSPLTMCTFIEGDVSMIPREAVVSAAEVVGGMVETGQASIKPLRAHVLEDSVRGVIARRRWLEDNYSSSPSTALEIEEAFRVLDTRSPLFEELFHALCNPVSTYASQPLLHLAAAAQHAQMQD